MKNLAANKYWIGPICFDRNFDSLDSIDDYQFPSSKEKEEIGAFRKKFLWLCYCDYKSGVFWRICVVTLTLPLKVVISG